MNGCVTPFSIAGKEELATPRSREFFDFCCFSVFKFISNKRHHLYNIGGPTVQPEQNNTTMNAPRGHGAILMHLAYCSSK